MDALNTQETLAELAALIDRFFRAVSFKDGSRPAYREIHEMFIEQGLLVKNSGAVPEISSLSQFIEPRQAMVDGGELTRFQEAERSHSTEIFGNIAHRFSAYDKSGTLKGASFDAKGMVSTQFIRTPIGWRISAMVWDDERPGLTLADHRRTP